VFIYNYLIKLKHSRGREVRMEAEEEDGALQRSQRNM
jgi:hypothetical protein